MENVTLAVKRFPGIAGAFKNGKSGGNLCVHPDESYGFIYDETNKLFLEVSLVTGRSVKMKTEKLEKYDDTDGRWFDFCAIKRASKLFILALRSSIKNNNQFIIISLSVNPNSISVVHTKCLNTLVGKSEHGYAARFQRDENGLIYFLEGRAYDYEIRLVDIADNGEVTSTNLDIHSLPPIFSRYNSFPFFYSSDLYWLSFSMWAVKLNNFLKIKSPLCNNTKRIEKIKVKIVDADWKNSTDFYYNAPVIIGCNMFLHYLQYKNHQIKAENLFVVNLDEETKHAHKFACDYGEHVIFNSSWLMTHSANGFLCLHGKCSLNTCKDGAHIYMIDVSKFQRKEASSTPNMANQNLEDNERRLPTRRLRRINTEEEARKLADIVDEKQLALDEATRVRLALEKEKTERQAADEEANRLRIERKVEDSGRKIAQKWTPTNFVKKEPIGKGAFGVVFKCFDVDAHKFFVAKETKTQTQAIFDAAKNEIEHLKTMSHIRIVDYYGFEVDGDTITIFREYMALESLKQVIENYGPMKEQVSIKYIEQILDALAYIHNIGIVHSDLKCDNLLHDGQGNVKLGDFGIAIQKTINSVDHSYFSQGVKRGGTCHWLAPEVLKGEGCSRRSDIWILINFQEDILSHFLYQSILFESLFDVFQFVG